MNHFFYVMMLVVCQALLCLMNKCKRSRFRLNNRQKKREFIIQNKKRSLVKKSERFAALERNQSFDK